MRRRAGTPDTFGVAAVDLFASATGMFLLMTFVLLPYFPNTGQTEGPDFPVLDLVIAVDTTGSMREEIAGLLDEVSITADVLGALSESAAVRVIGYKDRCHAATALTASSLVVLEREGVEELQEFIGGLRSGSPACDGDAEEDVTEALTLATGTEWRSQARRHAIVMIGDIPGHQDTQEEARAAAQAFSDEGGARRTVSMVHVDRASYRPEWLEYTEGFMRSVAEAGGGGYVRASESGSITGLILRALLTESGASGSGGAGK